MNVLENRSRCMNKVKGYINIIAPQLIKELEKGFNITKDSVLFKSDKERINKLLNSVEHFRAILKCRPYSITLTVNAHYKTDEHGCAYYEDHVYLWDLQDDAAFPFERRDYVTTMELESAEVKLKELEEKRTEIGYEISKLKTLLSN